MLCFDELERRWNASPPPLADRGEVHLIVLRAGDGAHLTPQRVELSPAHGLIGDRWREAPNRTDESGASLISSHLARLLVDDDAARAHLPGDNFHVDLDLGMVALPVGARLRLGTALIEITAKPHGGCAKFRDRFGADALRWVNAPERRHLRLRGVYGRILEAGAVTIGDAIVVVERPGA